ncbi:uncharacterized protein LOC6556808 [Drosophila grimshawi]|uniref:GH15998 n=1 Tax=Drosophila grimshawi TaxID=7222 RepID=B4J2B4_DROGR|nr:uncharacterized protein LOC6556808 [Drosophila grimshawi]EDV95973.1 GH15998 [Drosophila grimshawi]
MADVEEEEEEAVAVGDAVEEEADEVPKDEEEEAAQDLEEAGEQDALDETEDVPFELLDDEMSDNEEEELMYREYLDLIKQIDCQNAVISELKNRSHQLMDLPCQTRQDKAEYKQLRTCLDQENIKLNQMMHRAVQLQNNGSKRLYGNVELATTVFEDTLFYNSSASRPEKGKCPASTRRPMSAQEICDALDNSDTDSDDECCF